jgi:hypothetical protein
MLSLGCSKSALPERPQHFHLLGKVKGNVQIVPKGGKPSQGFIGDKIDRSSTLILGKNESATVICSDGHNRPVTSGRVRIDSICKDKKLIILQEGDGAITSPTR